MLVRRELQCTSWRISNVVDLLRTENVTEARASRLQKNRCRSFEAQEQLRGMLAAASADRETAEVQAYPITPDRPPRPCPHGVQCTRDCSVDRRAAHCPEEVGVW